MGRVGGVVAFVGLCVRLCVCACVRVCQRALTRKQTLGHGFEGQVAYWRACSVMLPSRPLARAAPLFPGKWTVFFDSKLHMRASMGELWAVYKSRVLQPWRVHNYSIHDL